MALCLLGKVVSLPPMIKSSNNHLHVLEREILGYFNHPLFRGFNTGNSDDKINNISLSKKVKMVLVFVR